MLRINRVGLRHELFVPTAVSRLVTADQKDAHTARVKGIENAIRAALVLDSQLAHVRILGAANRVGLWAGQRWAELFQDINAIGNAVLLVDRQPAPPLAELVREFDFPGR
jgi:hypothetical protein